MPNAQSRTAGRTSTARARSRKEHDPFELLKADHKKVAKMFKDFEKMKEKDRDGAAELVGRILAELSVHAQIEEEIFYPTMREYGGAKLAHLLDEAEV